jgi:hypothetical protein
MQSAWNDCAPDGPNFLQIGGVGLRIVFGGLGKNGARWACGATAGLFLGGGWRWLRCLFGLIGKPPGLAS